MNLLSAKRLAEYLLKKYSLDSRYHFDFDNSKRRFGLCDYRKREISLSKNLTLINSAREVYLTLLHEVAHALTKGHYHDKVWKRMLASIGGEPARCYDGPRSNRQVVKIQIAYTAVCAKHRDVGQYHRKRNLLCRACYEETGRWDSQLQYRANTQM